MAGIKTGSPGFVNPVDNKVYTIDPVENGDPGANADPLPNPDPGDLTVDKSIKDISKKTRITLGTYLSQVTKGAVGAATVPNKYSIDPSSDNSTTSKITENGYPVPPAPSGNSEQFAGGLGNYLSLDYVAVAAEMKKGKSSADLPDGNTLLPTAVLPGTNVLVAGVIQKYTDEEFKTNDFNPNEPFPIDVTAFVELPKVIDSTTKGTHDKSTQTVVKIDDLRKKPYSDTITAKNYYPVDNTLTDYSLTTDVVTNLPTQLSPSPANSKQFVDRRDINPSSNGDFAETSPLGVNVLVKGKQSVNENAFNGNRLLPDVKGNLNSSNNRFAKSQDPNNQAVIFGTLVSDSTSSDNPVNRYKGQRGSTVLEIGNNRFASLSSVNAQFNPSYRLSDGTEVSALKMAQVGAGLSQRASAEIPGFKSDPQNKFNPNGNIAELKAILPSSAQLGISKVNDQILAARDVLDSLDDNIYDPAALIEIAPFGGQSWGTLTNVSELYDDPSSVGLGITMISLVLAISVLFDLLTGTTKPSKYTPRGANNQLTLGSYKIKEPSKNGVFDNFSPGLTEVFGIRPIESGNSFSNCVSAGAYAFFLGANNSNVNAAQLTSALVGIGLDSLIGDGGATGANLVVCRTIIRSGLLLAEALSNVIKKFKLSGASGTKASLGILKVIKSSKLISALNVFASLGDTILYTQQNIANDDNGNPVYNVDKDWLYNAAHPDKMPFSSFFKNRLSSTEDVYNPTLAWSLQRAPSLYLLHAATDQLQREGYETLGSFAGRLALKNYNTKDTTHTSRVFHDQANENMARISNETRNKMEESLNAEYIPFSFHDVRTNEIISFHAFLASMTDDYSAHYDSIDAIGRVEPVKIYKGTTRRIGMSFHVVATSEDDFDHMWFKINKLLTMVYPQYTAGRELSGNNYNFKAPFSQLMGASPLVRIRLGDLIRSNYSRFALARLFGMTDNNVTIPLKDNMEKKIRFPEEQQEKSKGDYNAKIVAYVEKWSKNLPSGTQVTLKQPAFKKLLDELSEKEFASIQDFKKAVMAANNKNVKNAKLSSDNQNSDIDNFYKQINDSLTADVNSADAEIVIVQSLGQNYKIKYTPHVYGITIADVIIEVPKTEVNPTDNEKKKAQDQAIANIAKPATNTTSLQALQSFMSSNNNAIVKSFESAAGKGLAGFIDSMSFDWHDKVKWEIEPGSVAPKMCKVTIQFSPIHDISPGIDHHGYNRAPVYPAGSAMVSSPAANPGNGGSTGGPTG